MDTLGIDLAAAPAGTAGALISWRNGEATLTDLRVGLDDADIVELADAADVVGIDCPLGWPDSFVAFVSAHAHGVTDPREVDGGPEWRRSLAYRVTDFVVHEKTNRWPLSVSTDRLGVTALRCAGLLHRLRPDGPPLRRSGEDGVFEVYPGAALRGWGFDTRGYKTSHSARETLIGRLHAEAPWLTLGPLERLMVSSADAFDAVIASLATRAAGRGLFERPSTAHLEAARREGWIALPEGPLARLVRGTTDQD
ncbi:DUF429 domain-containing protein [Microbacterium radiodurans]|uniref:DUF429 domain-containing protein n=1 Tax=Microbacterium radiodurans TaxID=661398 RepID=A0A5J5ISE4_9MICO|nr:DUF429 domain-containing protein [Microbacterium radiodurans]KAA9086798.1 DUF429 domain-containing protein [Microbacterium radiodurans]